MTYQMERPMDGDLPGLNNFDRGTSADRAPVAIVASAAPAKRASGLKSAPPDLLGFLHERPVGEAAGALGLARGTVHNLRNGYWPRDPRKIISAWRVYQAKMGVVQSSWFMRRVYAGGVVRHARCEWTGAGLAGRTGQFLAVVRTRDGALLAQTLELPSERLLLREVA